MYCFLTDFLIHIAIIFPPNILVTLIVEVFICCYSHNGQIPAQISQYINLM